MAPVSLSAYLRLTSPSCVIRQAATMSSSRSIVEARLPWSTISLRKSSTLRAYSAEASAATSAAQVGLADDRHAVLDHRLVGLGQRAVAAHVVGPLPAAMSTITEPGFIALTISSVISIGAARPGISAVVMTMSASADALGDLDLLARQPARRHRPGVAADALGRFLLFVGLVRHVDELAAERLDLLLDARAARRTPRSPRRGAWRWRSPAGRRRRRRGSRTRAAFTVPAAVISIGKKRW